MTSGDEPSVSYRCPKCRAKLKAQAQDVGQRRECPRCGNRIKVPGAPASSPASGQSAAKPSSPRSSAARGIDHVAVVCPFCDTRLYAGREEAGRTMICPHCLESVAVPRCEPPAQPPKHPPGGPPVPRASSRSDAPADGPVPDTGNDDYRLTEPIELPRHRSVSGTLADLLDRHVPNDPLTGDAAPGADPDPGSGPRPPTPPSSFNVKCPVCDTLLEATADEVGTTKQCPDCYSSVLVPPPRPKRRRVSEVVESDYARDDFALGPPAERDIYKPTDEDVPARSEGEQALANAWREQAMREREEPELPLAPLWTGVFRFLPDFVLIIRLLVNGALVGATSSLMISVARYITSNDPSLHFYGIIGAIFSAFLTFVAVPLTSINFLAVLQDSAEGLERIENWPDASIADWIADSFSFLMALFFAVTPGMVIVFSGRAAGIPPQATWLLVGLSAYLFFPVAQLSILESASLANPISRPILASVRNQFLLWCTFYIMTFFLALAVALALSVVRLDHSLAVFLLLGIFLIFSGCVYARLLGRLAWACQMRPATEPDDASSQEGDAPNAGDS